MIRITTSHSAIEAEKYFDLALKTSDYYAKEQGIWGGKGARRLGLKGRVERKDFVALAGNKVPGTGKRLTLRKNTTREEKVRDKETGIHILDPETGQPITREVSNRRAGYDFTFSVPKSLSLYLAVNDDKVVEELIGEALDETMGEIEARMETKVRKGYQQENRLSPNVVYAKFIHGETRPVDGIPDPHYHVHVFAMNATFDEVEQQWKALEVGNTVGDRIFFEAHFNHLLATKLQAAGYGIRRTKSHFELASLSRELVEKFSRRTELIEQLARDKYRVLESQARALMKSTNMAFDDAFAHVVAEIGGDWDKWKSGLGARSREKKEGTIFKKREELLAHWQSEMTSQERQSLQPERVQGAASQNLLDVLGSKDFVISFKGPAGAGKTQLMTEAVTAIEALSRKRVLVLAPSTASVEVLRAQGFTNAETLQQFQVNSNLQEQIKGQVVWVDEAGFLSVRQMLELEEFAFHHNCRLILTGDTKQHHSVQWGDALRILERSDAIAQAALTKIYRQKVPGLREAIEDLSRGRTGEGFDKLDKFGVIHEIADDAGRLKAIAEMQIEAIEAQRSSLIIAPTHGECRAIAGAVRQVMKDKSLLSGAEHSVTRLERLNLTESQQRDAVTYEPGQVVEFHKIAKGGVWRGVREKRFKSGEQWEVLRREEGGVIVGKDGVEKRLPLDQARNFSVFEREKIMLSIGDWVRLTKNVKRRGQQFLNNELRTVVGIDDSKIIFDKGELVRNGVALHVDQGIVVTSHASQAKTVDQVIVSVPVRAFSQANEAQFYVSMSRARSAMHVFTDSKVALRDAVIRPSKRLSSWELLNLAEKDRTLKAELDRQRAKVQMGQQEKAYER